MQGRRNKFKSDFKAKLALKAFMGDKSIAERAQIYDVHPTQIPPVKKQLLDSVSSIFQGKHVKAEVTVDVDVLGL